MDQLVQPVRSRLVAAAFARSLPSVELDAAAVVAAALIVVVSAVAPSWDFVASPHSTGTC